MFPLIDVVFLLLTFFLYSQLVTAEVRTLPVELTAANVGELSPDQLFAVTIDRDGMFYFNEEALSEAALQDRLDWLASRPDEPMLFIAMAAESGGVDRGPLLAQVIAWCAEKGVNATIVGEAN